MNNDLLQQRFAAAMDTLPLVAILRGLAPDESVAVTEAIYRAGFRLIEVPLNSPQPFDSIARIRRALPDDAIVGAGTVLRAVDVGRVQDAGGQIIVMPHANLTVIRTAKEAGLLCLPGVATPTEAFDALEAGADALKLFPAELVGPAVIKAMRAVLPRTTPLLPVGGITPDNMGPYLAAGVRGFGLGSALYAPGMGAEEVARRAAAFVDAWHAHREAGML
ncbi:MAG: 2-dehydro-3-deoxy-6-phosphogalactonate aldolase [Rhodocyclaceae bacterium]